MKKKKLSKAIDEAKLNNEVELVTAASIMDTGIEAPEDFSDFYDYVSGNFADVQYLISVAASAKLTAELAKTTDVFEAYVRKNFSNADQILKSAKSDWAGNPHTVDVTPSESQWDERFDDLGTKANRVAVRKDGDNYIIDIPCYSRPRMLVDTNTMFQALGYPSDTFRAVGVDYTELMRLRNDQIAQFGKRLNQISGGQVLDYTKPIDFVLPITRDDLMNSPYVNAEAILEDYDDEEIDMHLSYVKGVRFVASAVPSSTVEGFNSSGLVELPEEDGTTTRPLSLQEIEDSPALLSDDVRQHNLKQFANTTMRNVHKERQNFMAMCSIEVPGEIAEYLVQTKQNDINMADLHTWATSIYRFSTTGGEEIEIVNPLTNVREVTQDMIKRPRTNAENLCVNPDGELVYIPQVDNIGDYYIALEEILKQDDGSFQERSHNTLAGGYRVAGEPKPEEGQKRSIIKVLPPNELLYVDWAFNKLAYTDTSGSLSILDLSNYRPAKQFGLRQILESEVGSDDNNEMFNFIRSVMNANGKKLSDFSEDDEMRELFPDYSDDEFQNEISWAKRNLESSNFRAYIMDVAQYAKATRLELMRRDGGVPENLVPVADQLEEIDNIANIQLRDCASNSKHTSLRCIGRALNWAYDKVVEDAMSVFRTRSVTGGMKYLARIMVAAKYTDQYQEVVAADNKEREAYQVSIDFSKDYQPQAIPFLRDDYAYLPHQVRADAELSRDPENAVLHVDAGGGKTHIILADVLRQMGKLFGEGKIGGTRRPLLMCPNNLIKNYVEDLIFMTKGKVNLIIVNTTTMNQYGEDKLAEMIKNAPVNTLVISEFDFMRNKAVAFPYGDTTVDMSLNCEFMRQFDWIFMSGDESHLLKNTGSKRSSFVGRLTADIDRRRIATGTFIHGMLQDAAGQFAQLDPTVFGSMKSFIGEYAAEVNRGKVVRWHDDAVPQVSAKVRAHSNFIRISRKEWAALLPPSTEEFHRLDLSQAQRDVYQSLLEKAIDEIKKNPQLMAKLKSGNEEDAGAIEMMLRPYLQRLEKFLAAPDRDELGELLVGEDRISPKAKKVAEILRNHSQGYKSMSGEEHGPQEGKVLIFTSYIASAESIYDSLPPDLQEQTMLYYAADGVKATKRFERDPKYKYLVGTEMSLNTGHNFQFVSRLIRIENIWNPGDLEQASSRLNRPDPKKMFAERANIFFDWLICDGTIDVTKCGRLVSKLLDTTRFNEENNPLYADIPNLELVSMTLDNILNNNDFGSADEPGSLWEYLEAYQDVAVARKKDYANWQAAYTGPTDPVPVPTAGILEGSALMDVPYIDNMQLPFTQELGIIPMNDYLSDKGLEVESLDMAEMRVHTEFGDGIVLSNSKHRCNVELDTGGKVSVSKLATFLIKGDDPTPIKQRLADMLELDIAVTRPLFDDDIDADEEDETPDTTFDDNPVRNEEEIIQDPVEKPTKVRKTSRSPRSDGKLNGKMYCEAYVINNMLALSFDETEPDMVNIKPAVFKSLGFRHSGGYIEAYIPTYRAMTRFLDMLEDKFEVKDKYLAPLRELQQTFKEGKRRLLNVNAASKVQMRQFFVDKRKAVPKGEVRPYPVINNGGLYITFALDKQPSAKTLNRSIKVPTVKWERNNDGEWVILANKKKEVKQKLKEIQKLGIEIANLEDVLEELDDLKILKPKKDVVAKPKRKTK
ncbi:hypothetical protein GR11A_00014 [Vibrio phage vB_VcorM_GR11A]|nr:hypothetical protein GR11A_00014 [Vibrio phage vB_VcorM_GR11A]